MIPASIQTDLGTWLWAVRPSHIVVQQEGGISEAEAIGPIATVDPTPMLLGTWWGESAWLTEPTLSNRQRQYLDDAGFPPSLAALATDALRRLLPRSVCTALAHEHETRMLIAPLYQTFVPFVIPLLSLGCDLAEADLWEDDHLMKRLLIPAEHWAAATEVSVAAALRRNGLRPQREPRGRDDRRPEYLVQLDFWRYFIEVKTNPDSLADSRAKTLERSIFLVSDNPILDSYDLVIEGSERLQRILHTANLPLPDLLSSDIRRDIGQHLAGAGRLPGRYPVGDYLVADIRPAKHERGVCSIALIPGSDAKDAYRVVRKIRDAANQIPQAAKGIAVIDIGSTTNLVAIQDATQAAFANAPHKFEPIRAIVFHAASPTDTGHRKRRIFGTPAPGVRPSAPEKRILQALLMPRLVDGDIIEERRYGADKSVLLEFARSTKESH